MRYLKTIAFLLIAAASTARADFIAYDVPPTIVGNQAFSGAVAMAFNVGSTPITITSLGIFDSGDHALSQDFTVKLYSRTDDTLMASIVIPAGSTADPSTGNIYASLAAGVTLGTGFQGMIVTSGFNANDPYYNYHNGQGPVPSTLDNSGLISYVGGGFFGSAGAPPSQLHPDGQSIPNPYAAATFTFVNAVPEPGSVALLGLGVACVFGLGARRRMAVRN